MRRIVLIGICILLFSSSELFADSIYLKNGNKVSGIITKESDETVEIKINIGATVSFSKSDIARIERASDDRHRDMKEDWQAEKRRRELEEMTRDVFEEQQIEKGLVKYKGKWVTPEERERLETAGLARDIGKDYHKGLSYRKGERSSVAEKLVSKGDWLLRETEHFSISYQDAAQAKLISDKAEYYFEKITYDLGCEDEIEWKEKCHVYIVENIDKWKDFLKDIGFNPELVGGFVPNYTEKEMFLCALSDGYLALTFPHELTHLIFRQIAGNSTIPLWLNEGLANYEASVTSISNELLIKYIKKGKHILLGDLLSMSGYPEGKEAREIFYAQSEKMVEFLITQHGREKFRTFCELILKDKSFKESLFKAYKGDFDDLEDFNIKLVEYVVK